VLASTALSLAYFARIVQRLYLEPGDGWVDRDAVSPGMVAAGVLAALVALALGLASAGLVEFLQPSLEVARP
jgi:NADH:ubiquinone oxidoreductase subunit 2 (subunit N)